MLKANPNCCEEASTLSMGGYIPCNQPAQFVVGWKGRSDKPIRMCAGCTDHNVRNRGGEIKHKYRPIDLGEVIKDLRMLDEPALDGGINLCYGDGYYAKSLEEKYGTTIRQLRDMFEPKEEPNTLRKGKVYTPPEDRRSKVGWWKAGQEWRK
jgi:hypothetical protein